MSSFFLATIRLIKCSAKVNTVYCTVFCKKRLSIFPSCSRDVTNQTPARESLGTGKSLNLFYNVLSFMVQEKLESFPSQGASVTNFKGRVHWINFLLFQERVNSFPPPAARSPPVSVTEFQPPYFPPPFSTASMALQQAKQLSTWIGQKKKQLLMWRILK